MSTLDRLSRALAGPSPARRPSESSPPELARAVQPEPTERVPPSEPESTLRPLRSPQTRESPSELPQQRPPLPQAPPAAPMGISRPPYAQRPLVAPPSHTVRQPHQPRLLTATVAGITRTLPLTGWSELLRVGRATLAYRLNRGWPPEQVLGLEPHSRDRAVEQAQSAAIHSRVLIVEDVAGGRRVVPRLEAAERLGIKPRSVAQRLRRYRPADGSSAQVPLSLLLGRDS